MTAVLFTLSGLCLVAFAMEQFFADRATAEELRRVADQLRVAAENERSHAEFASLVSRAIQHETARGIVKFSDWWEIFVEALDEGDEEEMSDARQYVDEAAVELPEANRQAAALTALGTSQDVEDTYPVTADDLAAGVQPSVSVNVLSGPEETIFGSIDLLKLMIRNIAKNAVAHGGATALNIKVEDSVLEITDDGQGSSSEVAEAAWLANLRPDGTTGQGLAITKRVIQAHGAECEGPEPQHDGGWKYRIKFNDGD